MKSLKLELVDQAWDILHLAITGTTLATVFLRQLLHVQGAARLEFCRKVGAVGHGMKFLGRLLRDEDLDDSVHPAHDGGHIDKEFLLQVI